MSGAIVQRLQSPDPAERRAACQQAADDAAAALYLEPLARALGDPDPSVSRAASQALTRLGRRVASVRDVLRDLLRRDPPVRRIRAALTLACLEPPAPVLLPALVEALAWHEGSVRWAAARVLVDSGRLHAEVLPLLLGLLRRSEQAGVRRMAAFCLRELAPERPEAARVLLEATQDPSLPVRRAAFTALPALVDPAPEVVARLTQACEGDPDPASRCIAAAALGELGASHPSALPSTALERLRALGAQTEQRELQRAAQRALARLGIGHAA